MTLPSDLKNTLPPAPKLGPLRQEKSLGRSWGLALMLIGLAGCILTALPYLGVGPDTSPSADSYLERRYGNIGMGLAMMWLAVMIAVLAIGAVMIFYRFGHRGRR